MEARTVKEMGYATLIALTMVSAAAAGEGPSVLWVTPNVSAPRVEFRTFDSATAGTGVSYHLYTPRAYHTQTNRHFPVFYWLHGGGDRGWTGIPRVAAHFDRAIAQTNIPPHLVVFVNGLVKGMYCDWKDGSVKLETVIVQELVPHIDAAYRTIEDRKGRVIEGFSMGGYGAARLGFKHPDLFGAVSILGGGPLQPRLTQTPRVGIRGREAILKRVFGNDQEYYYHVSPWRLAELNAEALRKDIRIRQVVGDRDETFAFNHDFHEHLEGLKIPHDWIVLPGVGHNPMAVLHSLGDHHWSFYRVDKK
jgi:enterochelin esterase-like enzyme